MYNNIGGKIKGLAMGFFITESVVAFIGGVALMVEDEDLIAPGLLLLLLGPLVAWVSSWLLYGFGELIDKTSEVARNTRCLNTKSIAQTQTDSARIEQLERLRSQGLITEEEYRSAVSKQ